MRFSYRFYTIAFCAAFWVRADASQPATEFHFQFTEQPGPYSVGFKVVNQYDRSRVFHAPLGGGSNSSIPDDTARPLQTLVWYPSETTASPAMTIGDYAALIHTETNFDHPVEHGKSQSMIADFTRGTTAVRTLAIRDAAMRPGHFPVAIYAPSINAPATENIELCEYLSTHGFVVLASPSMGETDRVMTADIAGAAAEAKDISFLVNCAKSLPDTDGTSIALIGYSWGGMAALFAAARDSRIGAFVSLDGSFRYAPETVQKAGDVHPDQLTIPILVFSRAEETLESWDATHQMKEQFGIAPNVLNQWTHGDLYHVHMLAMSHIQFSSLFQRSERFKKDGPRFAPADYSLEEGAVSYNWMCRYLLEFLNASLKHEASALLFLKRTPSENGVPKHFIAASFRAAAVKPVSSGPAAAK